MTLKKCFVFQIVVRFVQLVLCIKLKGLLIVVQRFTASWFPLITTWLTLWHPRLRFICYVCITVCDMNTVHGTCIKTCRVSDSSSRSLSRRMVYWMCIWTNENEMPWFWLNVQKQMIWGCYFKHLTCIIQMIQLWFHPCFGGMLGHFMFWLTNIIPAVTNRN